MANWWEMTAGEIARNRDAQKQRHDAYWATFMKDPVGRQVLAHLRYSHKTDTHKGETATENCLLICGELRVLERIRIYCGVDDELHAIEGEANASQSFKQPESPKLFDAAAALYGEHKKKETDK